MDILTAEEVARVLIFVAPGFFALAAYRFEYPQAPREPYGTLVSSVATSVPLVAITEVTRDWFGIDRDPLAAGYILLLLGTSVIVGYVFARLRGATRVRSALGRLGFRHEPESLVFNRTVPRMPSSDGQVPVTFKDDRVLAGTPRFWHSEPASARRELFLTHTRWYEDDSGTWSDVPQEGGVLINLEDVWVIELDQDPK